MGIGKGWSRRYRVALVVCLAALGGLAAAAVALDLPGIRVPGLPYAPEDAVRDGTTLPASPPIEHTTLQVGSPEVIAGEVAEVTLVLQNVPQPGLAEFKLEIAFAQDAVRVKEVLPGDSPWSDNDVEISNERGIVTLSNTKAEARSGTFLLATLKVEAAGEGTQTADVNLDVSRFLDSHGDRIPISLVGGHIKIARPPSEPLAEAPTAEPENPEAEAPPGEPEDPEPEAPPSEPERPEAEAPTAAPEGPEDDASTAEPESPDTEAPTDEPEAGPGEATDRRVGWLHVEGNRIVGQSGDTVVLRGVNIENREWIWHSERDIGFEVRAVTEATSPPPEGWGANIIILAVASGPVNRNNTTYLGHLDQLVDIASSNGAYTLLVYRYPEPDTSQPMMPDQAAEKAMATLASRYADEPGVLYGLQAEPHHVAWRQLVTRFTSMIDAIRAHNPRALVVVPGTEWSRYVYWALSSPVPRGNLVYKVHYYDSFDAAESQYRLSEVAAQYPLLLGEFGTGSRMGLSDVKELLDLAESRGISWAGWLFHEKACPCMLSSAEDFSPTPFGEEIRERLRANTTPRTSATAAPGPGTAPPPVPSSG